MYIDIVDKEIDKEDKVMLNKIEKLNQYLERSSYVDEYYRQYAKRLAKKIQTVTNK